MDWGLRRRKRPASSLLVSTPDSRIARAARYRRAILPTPGGLVDMVPRFAAKAR
jgi:hypothetical protein